MKDAYDDIRRRIDEPPLWWNCYGVPRYEEPPVPEHLLGAVGCQSCGRVYIVSPVQPVYIRNPFAMKGNVEVKEDAELDHKGKSHLRLREDWGYGDPPRHGCTGDSMSAVPRHSWDKDYYPDDLFPDPSAPFEELKRIAWAQAVENRSDGWTSEIPTEPGLVWYDSKKTLGDGRSLALVEVFCGEEDLRAQILWDDTGMDRKIMTHSQPLHSLAAPQNDARWLPVDIPPT